MPYFLVLLTPTGNNVPVGEHHPNPHEAFVDKMIQEKVVLLGGDFVGGVGKAEGAYLLHTASRGDSEAWVVQDPFIRSGAYSADIIEGEVVAIDPAAADQSDIIKRGNQTDAG